MGVIDYLIRRRVKTLEDQRHAFEVTNLTIPAGTDWTQQYEIGRFTLDPHHGVAAFVSLEISAPITVGNLSFGTTSLAGSGGAVTLGEDNSRIATGGGILPFGSSTSSLGFWGDLSPP